MRVQFWCDYQIQQKTPQCFIYHDFIDNPGGSVYQVPRVLDCMLPVLLSVYDSIEDCISISRKYASEARFGDRLSCQKRLSNGFVKEKCLV